MMGTAPTLPPATEMRRAYLASDAGYGGGIWRKQRLLDLERGARALV